MILIELSNCRSWSLFNPARLAQVDNRPSTSRIQPQESGDSPTIDEIREARNVYDRLLKCLDDKERRIEGHDRELLEKDMEIESLRAKVELCVLSPTARPRMKLTHLTLGSLPGMTGSTRGMRS